MNNQDPTRRQYKKYLGLALGSVFLVILVGVGWGAIVVKEQVSNQELWLEQSQSVQDTSLAFQTFTQLIGYGGLIHHFKNYILRQEDQYAEALERAFARVRAQEDLLRSLLETQAEREKLDQIMVVIEDYSDNFQLARSLIARSETTATLDQIVKVSDAAAVDGLSELSQLLFERRQATLAQHNARLEDIESLIYSGLFLLPPLLLLGFVFFYLFQKLRALLDRFEGARDELKLMLETTPNPVLAINENGVIFRANKTAVDYFGYGEALIGSTVESLMPEQYRAGHVKLRSSYFEHPAIRGMAPDRRIPALLASGEVREIAVRLGHAVTDAKPFSVISLRDVTEENAHLEMIEKAHARIEFAANVARFAIWEWDLKDDSVSVEQGGAHIADFSGSYRAWSTLIHPDDVEAVDSAIRQGILDSSPIHSEFRAFKGEGAISYLQLSAGVQLGNQGMPRSVTGILNDVTVARRAQNSLETARSQAVMANEAKSQFLANMSHEIRTPMNAILGLLMLLDEANLEERQKQLVSNAHVSAKTLLNILNDILDFSKLEADKVEIYASPFSLDDLIHQTVDLFSGVAARKSLTLHLEVKPDVYCGLVGDLQRIVQVISNLLSNAIKFTSEGGVTLAIANAASVENDQYALRFSVSDSGIGMSEEQLSRVLEPFAQADMGTTRNYGGTGLGLPICTALISLMGGKMGINSEPGKGTQVTFDLPLGLDADSKRYSDFSEASVSAILAFRNHRLESIVSEHFNCWGMSVTRSEGVPTTRPAGEELGVRPVFLLTDYAGEDLRSLGKAWERSPWKASGRLIVIAARGITNLPGELIESLDPIIISEPPTPARLYAAVTEEAQIGSTASPSDAIRQAMEIIEPFQGARLLVVEDVQTNQLIAKDFLARLGMQVDIANNGFEALARVRAQDYDAVLMDFHMPLMGGLEAVSEIRKDQLSSDLPVIAMTAAAFEDDRIRARAAGMDGFLSKPIDIVALARVLAEHLPATAIREEVNTSHTSDEQSLDPHTLLDSLPIRDLIDRSRVVANYSGSMPIYLKCLRTFALEFSDWPEALKSCRMKNDLVCARGLVHKLKGAAANIAAKGLHEAASSALDELEGGEFTSVDEVCEQLKDFIEGVRLSPGMLDLSKPSGSLLNARPIRQRTEVSDSDLLSSLQKSLMEQRYIPPDILETWLSSLYLHVEPELVDNLKKSIELFDYAEAQYCLSTVIKKTQGRSDLI